MTGRSTSPSDAYKCGWPEQEYFTISTAECYDAKTHTHNIASPRIGIKNVEELWCSVYVCVLKQVQTERFYCPEDVE